MVTEPADGLRRPPIMLSSVDFPAPFGPRRPVIPELRPNEMSFTATTLPYQRDAFRSSTASGPEAWVWLASDDGRGGADGADDGGAGIDEDGFDVTRLTALGSRRDPSVPPERDHRGNHDDRHHGD